MKDIKWKGNRIYQIIVTVLVIVILFSGFGVVRDYLEARRSREEYKRLAELARTETEAQETPTEAETLPEAPYVSPIDFAALSEINPDIVGWITIPDTNIDYPIVQCGDNDKYLKTGFDGEKNRAGTIFLDFESDSDMEGRNNIIYGHNMKNGTMFKDIVKYKDKAYFDAHQTILLYTPERTIRLKALAAYYDVAKPIARMTKFKSQESFDQFVKDMITPCSYAQLPDQPIPKIYSLITCSYEINDARTFLFAAEVDEQGNVIAVDEEEGE